LSRGAKNTKNPWSRRSRSLPRAAWRPLVRDDLRGAGLARHVVAGQTRAAAGARGVHDHPQPLTQRRQRVGLERNVSATAGAGTGFQPWPSSIALSTCGVTRVPPLATVEIITASDAA
jgi:hypothetical protein